MPLESGQSLLHYRLIEKLGEGGMGVVWKALDTTLDCYGWSADGKELFYADSSRFYVMDVETEPVFSHGRARLLFEMDHARTPGRAPFDVAPDGKRFVVVRPTSQIDTSTHLNVVVNWFATLRDLGE